MPVHIQALILWLLSVLGTSHVFGRSYCLKLSDLKRVPIKTEIITACLLNIGL